MESIWKKTAELKRYAPLRGDIHAEVAVIGGGMAGILTAYFLQQRGIETVVLEERRIGQGQTGGTTAKITCQHDLIYDRLIRLFGMERARQYAKANLWAVHEYERLIAKKKIDCEFSRKPSFLYSTEGTKALEREVRAARLLGIDAKTVRDPGLPFPVREAACFANQGQFHPLLFLRELAKELTVYEGTKVLAVEGGKRGADGHAKESRVITDKGSVTASHVVFACHFPFVNFPGLYFLRMHQERSYVLALENAKIPEGMFLGVDPDGISLRRAGDLVLLGGGGRRTGGNEKNIRRYGGEYEKLRRKASVWFPGCKEAARWSAQDCMTIDGVPYIGKFAASRPGWYVATGFNKWGMSSSMAAAQIIADQIGGVENPYAKVFSPQRFMLRASAAGLAANVGVSTVGLTEGLFSAKGTEKIATKKCPHLGCRLKWNSDDGLWECPCHGSCFGENGKRLEGPAQNGIVKTGTADHNI